MVGPPRGLDVPFPPEHGLLLQLLFIMVMNSTVRGQRVFRSSGRRPRTQLSPVSRLGPGLWFSVLPGAAEASSVHPQCVCGSS